MNKSGFTLIEIMIIVGILVILVGLALPNVLRSRQTANESLAKANLRTIFSACQMYSYANNGNYPASEQDLRESVPPYQNQAFCGRTLNGYLFECEFSESSFLITATPSACGKTGSKIFTISTGGHISEESCAE